MENISNKLKIAMIITILIPILMLLLFLIGLSKVEAQTYTYYLNGSKANLYSNDNLQKSLNYSSVSDNVWFYNFGGSSGNNIRIVNNNNINLGHADIVLFNMRLRYTPNTAINFPNINSVGFSDEACYYGATNNQEINSSLNDTYITAICFMNQDLNYASGSNIANINFDMVFMNDFTISNITIVDNKDTARELQTLINSISGKLDTNNSRLLDINSNLSDINSILSREEILLSSIKTNTENIYTVVQWIDGLLETIVGQNSTINNSINNNTQAVNDMANEDIDNNTKQQVDNTNVNDYNTKEANLMNTATQTNLNDVNIGIDTTANRNIWQLITRILNTNAKVIGLVISILSIGIIKLMLSR